MSGVSTARSSPHEKTVASVASVGICGLSVALAGHNAKRTRRVYMLHMLVRVSCSRMHARMPYRIRICARASPSALGPHLHMLVRVCSHMPYRMCARIMAHIGPWATPRQLRGGRVSSRTRTRPVAALNGSFPITYLLTYLLLTYFIRTRTRPMAALNGAVPVGRTAAATVPSPWQHAPPLRPSH